MSKNIAQTGKQLASAEKRTAGVVQPSNRNEQNLEKQNIRTAMQALSTAVARIVGNAAKKKPNYKPSTAMTESFPKSISCEKEEVYNEQKARTKNWNQTRPTPSSPR